MKFNIINFKTLTGIAMLAAFASCSSDITDVTEVGKGENGEELVPITLHSGMSATTTTRGSIITENGVFTIPVAGTGSRQMGALCLARGAKGSTLNIGNDPSFVSEYGTWENPKKSDVIYWNNYPVTTEGQDSKTFFNMQNISARSSSAAYYPSNGVKYLFAAYYPRYDNTEVKYRGNKAFAFFNPININTNLVNTTLVNLNFDFIYGVDDMYWNLTREDKDKLKTDAVTPYAYSSAYYTNGVSEGDPVIEFKHAFMRFQFAVKGTENVKEGMIAPTELEITEFQIEDVPCTGELCIVDMDTPGAEGQTGKFVPTYGWTKVANYEGEIKDGIEYKNAFCSRFPMYYTKHEKMASSTVPISLENLTTAEMPLFYTTAANSYDAAYGKYDKDGLIVPVPYDPEKIGDEALEKTYKFRLKVALRKRGTTDVAISYIDLAPGMVGTSAKWVAGQTYKVLLTINGIQSISAQLQLDDWIPADPEHPITGEI